MFPIVARANWPISRCTSDDECKRPDDKKEWECRRARPDDRYVTQEDLNGPDKFCFPKKKS